MAELIREQAENRADDIALIDEGGETSWSDFNGRVNQLISGLRARGLKTGDAFAVLSGNRREYVEAFAAAAHGGWLLVPINWHLVPEEVSYILVDSGAKALFVDERFHQLGLDTLNHEAVPGDIPFIEFGSGGEEMESYEIFLAQE